MKLLLIVLFIVFFFPIMRVIIDIVYWIFDLDKSPNPYLNKTRTNKRLIKENKIINCKDCCYYLGFKSCRIIIKTTKKV